MKTSLLFFIQLVLLYCSPTRRLKTELVHRVLSQPVHKTKDSLRLSKEKKFCKKKATYLKIVESLVETLKGLQDKINEKASKTEQEEQELMERLEQLDGLRGETEQQQRLLEQVDSLQDQLAKVANNQQVAAQQKTLLQQQQGVLDQVDSLEGKYEALSLKADRVDAIMTSLSSIKLATDKIPAMQQQVTKNTDQFRVLAKIGKKREEMVGLVGQCVKEESEMKALEEQITECQKHNVQLENMEEQIKGLEGTETVLTQMKSDLVTLQSKPNQHIPLLQGGNCMINAKVLGVYDAHGVIPVSSSSFVVEGAVRPSGEINNPYSFQQTHNYDGKYCISAEESELNIIFDLQKNYKIWYLSLFVLQGMAKSFQIKKYQGESESPLPSDPAWKKVTKESQVGSFCSSLESLDSPRIVELISFFETRFMMLTLKGDGKVGLQGIKAFI